MFLKNKVLENIKKILMYLGILVAVNSKEPRHSTCKEQKRKKQPMQHCQMLLNVLIKWLFIHLFTISINTCLFLTVG